MIDKSSSTGRVPLSIHSAFERMNIAPRRRPLERSLQNTLAPRTTLQEFRPLCECLEWELSELAWRNLGVLPFAQNDVPFIVTNSGRLSEHAATLLYESCRQKPPGNKLQVLELGAGCGLFARLFLDAFEAICEQEVSDFYERLEYIVSDGSIGSLRDWEDRGVFDEHAQRVKLTQGNARFPQDIDDLEAASLRAVFCNYVLDVLPATVIRKHADGLEELMVRTHLITDPAVLAQHTALTSVEIVAIARAEDPARRSELLPLLSLLELETDFKRVDGSSAPAYLNHATSRCRDGERRVINHGAIECIEACLGLLEDDGFILINDYGPTGAEEQPPHAGSQRFGPTLALGINFPLLGTLVDTPPWTVTVPDNDAEAPLHARLIAREGETQLTRVFNNRFGAEGYAYFEQPVEQAREHARAGRKDQALDTYREALTRNRRDWFVLGEIAEYVGLQLRDPAAGIELAQEAVRLNPWYSAWLWNVLGDCLFCLERFADAHEAYLQAQRIDPEDPRTNFNLAFTHAEFREYEAALCAIGRGLAHDPGAMLREQLLEKQRQILSALSARALGEHERLVRRTLSHS